MQKEKSMLEYTKNAFKISLHKPHSNDKNPTENRKK